MRVTIRLVIKTKLIVFAIYTIYYVHVFWKVPYTLFGWLITCFWIFFLEDVHLVSIITDDIFGHMGDCHFSFWVEGWVSSVCELIDVSTAMTAISCS